MNRKLRLDAIELDQLIQDTAFGRPDADLAEQAREEDPAGFDAAVAGYRQMERELGAICAGVPARPTRSPLQEAFAARREKEARRARIRRTLDDRLIHFGVQRTLVHATQNVARGLVGISVTTRGIGRILGTLGTTVNVVVLNRVSTELPGLFGADRGVIDVTPGDPEGSPA